MTHHAYRRLLVMTVLSFLSMYALMYAMVDAPDRVYRNMNQVYMAALMTAPMVALELVLMAGMYRNRRANAILLASAAVVGALCFSFIRQQTGIADRQFLRSMIPHHSGAILMCEEASIEDQAIAELCQRIIASQDAEIREMKALLDEHEES